MTLVNKSISTLPPKVNSLNFELLRAEGLEHIVKLGHDIWTDFNSHDPGITMLEVLSYAITDLGYRTSFPIEDLTANPTSDNARKHFFDAKDILTCNPVTPNDFRRLLIDIDGIKNAWVKKANFEKVDVPNVGDLAIKLQGVYDVIVELDNQLDPTNAMTQKAISEKVFERLMKYRNLCEDFNPEILFVQNCHIPICLDLELKSGAEVNQVKAQILNDLEIFLTPSVRFYSLSEMRAKGKSCEDIFQGAILENGFLDEEELDNSMLRQTVYKSDLYQVIMDVVGVKAIKELKFTPEDSWCHFAGNCQEGEESKNIFKPVIDSDSSFHFQIDNATIKDDPREVNEKLELIRLLATPLPLDQDLKAHIPTGRYRNLEDFHSIFEEFPLVYRIGEGQIPRNVKTLHRAQIRQLKGYLVFFEQIFVNYLAQLGSFRDLFCVEQDASAPLSFFGDLSDKFYASELFSPPVYKLTNESIEFLKTEFPAINFDQIEVKVDGNTESTFLNKIAKGLNHDNPEPEIVLTEEQRKSVLEKSQKNDLYNNILSSLTQPKSATFKKRNQILDHLIARFGEQFSDYAASLFLANPTGSCLAPKIEAKDNLLQCKIDFLSKIDVLGRDRGKGFNYKQLDCDKPDIWETVNVAGLKKRVSSLLCLSDANRKRLFCDPQIHIIKVYDQARTCYRLAVIEEGDKDKKVLLLGSKEYTKGSRSKRDENILITALVKMLGTSNDDNYSFYFNGDDNIVELKKGGRLLAIASNIVSPEAATELRTKLLMLTYPADCSREGFHLLEHILLRDIPDHVLTMPTGDPAVPLVSDPYSFWITVIVPEQWVRFKNNQTFFNQMVRHEAPAHIGIRILWLGARQLYSFEEAYLNWLYDLARIHSDDCQIEESGGKLIDLLNSFGGSGAAIGQELKPEDLTSNCKSS